MTKTIKQLQTLKNTFWCIVFVIFACILMYGYFVNKTVHNVAERQKIEKKISAIHAELSELEFKYISMRNKISPEYAHSLGFTDLKKQQFVSSKGGALGLSYKPLP